MKMPSSQTGFRKYFDVAAVSDKGCLRSENQDAWMADESLKLVVVCDGMGGGPAGAQAAQMVTGSIPDFLRKRVTGVTPSRKMARELLRDAVLSAGQEILNTSEDDPERKGMGTTVVAAWQCGRVIHLAHQGDSRAYLLRDCGLQKLTADHSIIALLVRNGEVTEENAVMHPARGQLTRFVGMQGDVYCDIQTVDIKEGDRLLLCTDGLWGVVTDDDITGILSEHGKPGDICRNLVKLALLHGAPDNVTAVVWDIGGVE